MDARLSAGLFWRGPVLVAAALLLGACATEMAAVQPPPPPVAAAPAPAPAPEPPQVSPAPPAPEAPSPPAAAVAAPALPAPAPEPQPVRGPIEVTGVEVQETAPGALAVLVSADGPIATYESFTLPDPPRLVLDIPNAVNAIPQPVSARPPLVKAVRASQYREQPLKVVRIVLDLEKPLTYEVKSAENQLRVELGGAAPSAPAPAGAAAIPAAAGPAAAVSAKVTRIDMQSIRGRQRIVIGTSGQVTYRVSETLSPPSLLVEVIGAALEPAAARTLDLRQVASPVNRLEASQVQTAPEPIVRVLADLREGPVKYEVQQTASAITVNLLTQAPAPAEAKAPVAAPTASAEVNAPAPPAATPPAAAPPVPAEANVPVAPSTAPVSPAISAAAQQAPALAPPAQAAAPAATQSGRGEIRRISMDFKDADINNLLRIIAEVSEKNVVAGDDVKGKVTVRLVNVDWRQALDVILKINGLGYEEDGNIIRVASQAKLAAEQQAREDARKREEDARLAAVKAQEAQSKAQVQLEPLQTAVIAVNYAKAADVVKNLSLLKTPGRADTSIVVDDRTNKLIIQETAGTIGKMKNLLHELDQPTPQVLIEARLVEATWNFSQSLGIEWGASGTTTLSALQAQPISIFTSSVGTTMTAPATIADIPLAISMPASSPTAGLGIIAGNLFNNNLALMARISAGESEGKVRTLSAPKVTTLDNQEAEVKQGQQVPYTTIDSSGRTVVAFQDAFIRLKVTPHITNDRRISMKVEAERSFPGTEVTYSGGFVFPINTRKATTNVLVSNGATVVIGGLLQTDDSWTESRVPWLSNVPILGSLFKSTTLGPNDKIELLIFLTPTILEETKLS